MKINRDALTLATVGASFAVSLTVLWRKFGGTMSGGRFSTAHSWPEMRAFIPEFLYLFFIAFVAIYVWNSMKKKPESVICPNCEEAFLVPRGAKFECKFCGTPCEPLHGYYERRPKK